MADAKNDNPLVGIVMGSASDWPTMKKAAALLEEFGVGHECKVLSAHRTPEEACEYARSAEGRGLRVIIAGAGLAAHLAGALAAHTTVPVLGVPMEGGPLKGMDALLATVQMPAGIPVGTFGIGSHGAKNAALFAVAMLAVTDPDMRRRLHAFRKNQAKQILDIELS